MITTSKATPVLGFAFLFLSGCNDGAEVKPVELRHIEFAEFLSDAKPHVEVPLVLEGFYNDTSPEGTRSLYLSEDDAARVASDGYVNLVKMGGNRIEGAVCAPGDARVLGFAGLEPELLLYAYKVEIRNAENGVFEPCFYTSFDLEAMLADSRFNFTGK